VRDSGNLVNRDSLKKELGDVLWFVAVLSEHYNIDLQDVAIGNINKLRSRQQRGTLQGSGDDR
jgi:NTP pyrophosphatase (non-canonical NTP hydrolase)